MGREMRTQTKASLTTFIDKRSHKRQISAWVYNGQRARVRRTSQLLGEAGSRSGDRQKSVQGSNRGVWDARRRAAQQERRGGPGSQTRRVQTMLGIRHMI